MGGAGAGVNTRQAASVYRLLRTHGFDAWAGVLYVNGEQQAVVTVDRRGDPLHLDQFQFLVQLARERELDLSWGSVRRAVLVLS